jgi:hypothetical protein
MSTWYNNYRDRYKTAATPEQMPRFTETQQGEAQQSNPQGEYGTVPPVNPNPQENSSQFTNQEKDVIQMVKMKFPSLRNQMTTPKGREIVLEVIEAFNQVPVGQLSQVLNKLDQMSPEVAGQVLGS